MTRAALIQGQGVGGAAAVPVPAHHTVHLIKQPKEAPVQGIFCLFRNGFYRQSWLGMLLIATVPAVGPPESVWCHGWTATAKGFRVNLNLG